MFSIEHYTIFSCIFFFGNDFKRQLQLHVGLSCSPVKYVEKCYEIRTHKVMPQHENQPCKFCPHKIGKTLVSASANC